MTYIHDETTRFSEYLKQAKYICVEITFIPGIKYFSL